MNFIYVQWNIFTETSLYLMNLFLYSSSSSFHWISILILIFIFIFIETSPLRYLIFNEYSIFSESSSLKHIHFHWHLFVSNGSSSSSVIFLFPTKHLYIQRNFFSELSSMKHLLSSNLRLLHWIFFVFIEFSYSVDLLHLSPETSSIFSKSFSSVITEAFYPQCIFFSGSYSLKLLSFSIFSESYLFPTNHLHLHLQWIFFIGFSIMVKLPHQWIFFIFIETSYSLNFLL